MLKSKLKFLITLLVLAAFFASCGGGDSADAAPSTAPPTSMLKKEIDPMETKGIGPVSSVELGELDMEMAAEGEKIYSELCTACHKPTEKFIGPAPKGVLDRRTPEWVMNMILNPEEMVQKDPLAKKLLMEYNGSPMANQNLTQEQARQVLEYFRTL
jgi:mono/diheme cytochrome c family protein